MQRSSFVGIDLDDSFRCIESETPFGASPASTQSIGATEQGKGALNTIPVLVRIKIAA